MNGFVTHLEVELVGYKADGTPMWALSDTLVYDSRLLGFRIRVPRGFVTDFASVPRLPLVFLLAGDTAHAPAVVHDWLYSGSKVSRRVADKVFLEAMTGVGVPWFRRNAMYWAVRLFGGRAYAAKA